MAGGWPTSWILSARYKVGAPLFAFFAKGGHDAACGAGFDFVENLIVQTASYPPLHKTQGRGTHSSDDIGSHRLGPRPIGRKIDDW
jgi:hypothetical protein